MFEGASPMSGSLRGVSNPVVDRSDLEGERKPIGHLPCTTAFVTSNPACGDQRLLAHPETPEATRRYSPSLTG